MSVQDRSLKCADCGLTFVFTATEQELQASRGMPKDPERCPECRAIKKTQRHGDGDHSYRSRSWK